MSTPGTGTRQAEPEDPRHRTALSSGAAKFLEDSRRLLSVALGARLRGVVLYGSEARGEATPSSDIDLLVLLQGPVALGTDMDTIIRALYSLQLELERPLHVLPVDEVVFHAGRFALFRSAQREGRVA